MSYLEAARKRRLVAEAYPGDKWASKVEKMSDAQVHTVYIRLINTGRIKA